MKKYLFTLLILLSTTLVHAQNYGFDIILRGGAGIPENPSGYQHTWNTGPHFAAGFEFNLSQSVSVGLLGEFLRNEIHTDSAPAGGAPDSRWGDGAMENFSMSLFLDYRFAGRAAGMFPYLIIDAGFSHIKTFQQTLITAGVTESLPVTTQTAARTAGGIGIDIPMSANVCFTVTGKYVHTFTRSEGTGYIPIDAGFKMVF